MSVGIGHITESQEDVALDALMRAAQVVHDLSIRGEVCLARRPGLVDDARALADALSLEAVVEIGADEIWVRFEPR
jgi:hypothetical protein